MKNTIKLRLGILVMILVFGMTVVGCGDDIIDDDDDDDDDEKRDNTIYSVSISLGYGNDIPKVGSRLSTSVKNIDGDSVSGVSYQWKRADSQSGTFVNINDATSGSYTPIIDDTGKYIKVEAKNSDTTTPVLSNAVGPVDANQVVKPTASPDGGEVAPGQKITLSTTTQSAQIYYTLDGSTPTKNSTLYSYSRLEITERCTLKAIAAYYGMTDSEVLTVSYTVMPGISFSPITTSVFSYTGIRAVAYGNYMFVAAGNNIAYSSNGTSWTASSSDIGSIYSITYGGSQFVAVGSNGRIAYSSNGTSWTTSTSTPFGTTTINSVAYGNNRYVAVGEDGKRASSTNGSSWTSATGSAFGTSTINDVAYGAGKFVAVGSGGKIAFSTDGQAWTAITNSGLTGSINGIAYGGTSGKEKFVVVGGDGLAYSTDGLTWTKITTSFYLSSLSPLKTITWGGNKFVAGGYAGVMVYSNADGTLWAKIDGGLGAGKSQFDTTDAVLFRSSINDIAYGAGKFLAVGSKVVDILSNSSGEMAISN